MLILEIDPNTSHLFRTEHLLMRIFMCHLSVIVKDLGGMLYQE